MSRKALLLFVVAAFLAGGFFAPPMFLWAGHTPGLSSRTHLIVKEHNLKILVGGVTSNDIGQVSEVDLREQLRDSTLAPLPYEVPLGKVFVVTDMQITHGVAGALDPGPIDRIDGWIRERRLAPTISAVRYFFFKEFLRPSVFVSADFQLTGGLPFMERSGLVCRMNVQGSQVPNTWIVRVIGYETSATAQQVQ